MYLRAPFCVRSFIALAMLLVAMAVAYPVRADAPPTSAPALLEAEELLSSGQIAAAVIQLKNILQTDPDHAAARLLLGKTYMELRQGAYAEKELRRALTLGMAPAEVAIPLAESLLLQQKYDQVLETPVSDPGLSDQQRATLHALYGNAYLGQQQPLEAEQAYRQALQLDPSNSRALEGLALKALQAGATDSARTHIEAALAAVPDSPIAWSLLGDLEHAQTRLMEADQAYTRAMENSAEHSAVQLKRALVRIDLGDFAGADEDIRAVERIAAGIPQLFYVRGLWLLRQDRIEAATEALDQAYSLNPSHPLTQFYLGLSNYLLGRYEQAAEVMGRYLAGFPQSVSAAKVMAVIRLRQGDLDGAQRLAQPLLEQQPDDTLLLLVMADIKQAQGDAEAERGYREKLAQLQPQSAARQLEWGLSQLRAGAGATQQLQEAVKLAPDSMIAEIALISSQLHAGQYDQALEAARAMSEKWPDSGAPWTLMGIAQGAQGNLDQAQAAFQEALKRHPGDPSAASNLAALALKRGDLDHAQAYYGQILQRYPGNLDTLIRLAELEAGRGDAAAYRALVERMVKTHPRVLEPRLRMARIYLEQGKPGSAQVTLREVETYYADNPQWLAVMGEAQLAAGDSVNAQHTLDRLISLEPDSGRGYFLLSQIQAAKGEAGKAQRTLLSGLKKNQKEVVEAYRQQSLDWAQGRVVTQRLASAQWKLQDFAGHLRTLEEWLQRYPDDAAMRFALANSYLQLERLDEAERALVALLKENPDHVPALNNLAWLWQTSNPEQARAHAEHALKLDPTNPAVQDTLGLLLLSTEEKARGLQLIEQAVEKEPQDPNLRFHLALALSKSGDGEKALAMLNGLLEKAGQFAGRNQAEALQAELLK